MDDSNGSDSQESQVELYTFAEPNCSHFEILSALLVNDAVTFIGKTGHTAEERYLSGLGPIVC